MFIQPKFSNFPFHIRSQCYHIDLVWTFKIKLRWKVNWVSIWLPMQSNASFEFNSLPIGLRARLFFDERILSMDDILKHFPDFFLIRFKYLRTFCIAFACGNKTHWSNLVMLRFVQWYWNWKLLHRWNPRNPCHRIVDSLSLQWRDHPIVNWEISRSHFRWFYT